MRFPFQAILVYIRPVVYKVFMNLKEECIHAFPGIGH
jgi:hypothetical protein